MMYKHAVAFDAAPSEVLLRIVELPRGPRTRTPEPVEPPTAVPPPEDPTVKLRTMVESMVQAVTAELAELKAVRAQASESMQDATVELALMVASHVIQSKIDAAEFDLRGIVQTAVAELLPANSLVVDVHPEDAALFADSLKAEWQALRQEVELQEDASLPRGSCRVRNEQHALLSTPEIRLQNARESLNQAMEYDSIED